MAITCYSFLACSECDMSWSVSTRWLVFILQWMEHSGLSSCEGVRWCLEVFWQVTRGVSSCGLIWLYACDLLYIPFLCLTACVLRMWLSCKCPLRVARTNFFSNDHVYAVFPILCCTQHIMHILCIFSYASLNPFVGEGRMSFIHFWWTIKTKVRNLWSLY